MISTPPALLLIDKPKGITSFDVIRKLRQTLGIKKMGHGGTLDPRATGLMLIGVGEGTKLLTQLIKQDKEYIATIMLGERRTTGDMEGEILEEKEVGTLDPDHVRTTLAGLVGTLFLPVSPYSAIKRDGVPMYKRARAAAKKGEVVEDVPMRTMQVHEAELLEVAYVPHRALLTIRFKVASGTYIRSLGEELGKRLQYPATLADLRRTQIGTYRIEDAAPLLEHST